VQVKGCEICLSESVICLSKKEEDDAFSALKIDKFITHH